MSEWSSHTKEIGSERGPSTNSIYFYICVLFIIMKSIILKGTPSYRGMDWKVEGGCKYLKGATSVGSKTYWSRGHAWFWKASPGWNRWGFIEHGNNFVSIKGKGLSLTFARFFTHETSILSNNFFIGRKNYNRKRPLKWWWVKDYPYFKDLNFYESVIDTTSLGFSNLSVEISATYWSMFFSPLQIHIRLTLFFVVLA